MSKFNGFQITGLTMASAGEPSSVTGLAAQAADKLDACHSSDDRPVRSLILITQDEDFLFPSTAFAIQSKLQLTKDCMVYDITLGADGFITGIETAIGLLCPFDSGSSIVIAADESLAVAASVERTGEASFVFEHESRPEHWDISWQSRWGGERILQKESYLSLIHCAEKKNYRSPLIFPQRQMSESTLSDSPVTLPCCMLKEGVLKENSYSLAAVGAGGSVSVAHFTKSDI